MRGSFTGRIARFVLGFAGLLVFSSSGSAADRIASSLVSSWASADFDGNRTVDVARSSTVARDNHGYLQEVRIDLGAALSTSFSFHSRSARIQLGVRDIDGDEDRDLVVSDSLTHVAIGVWLNDGDGNFSETDLARYAEALDTRNPKSLTAPQSEAASLFADIAQDYQAALTPFHVADPNCAVTGLAPEGVRRYTARRPVRLRSRAPPRNV